MRRSLIAACAIALLSAPAYALDRDPSEVAMNQCMVFGIEHHKKGDDWLWYCMQEMHFAFCDKCKVFVDHGAACQEDKEWGVWRSTCWQLPVRPVIGKP
ncbi:MAG TPA: hypothetical protein VHT52_17610 [Stellaceae bacterium]|jgi:hypothetical protein|nr:hypothetical protein [Stellaceae bacterium]